MSDEEDDAFERAMADVRRLPVDPRGERVRAAPTVPPVPTNEPAPVSPREEEPEADEAAFAAPGVDRRELRKLRRGDYIPGDRLDLHGLMAAEAVAQVLRFIERSRSRHRAVAIVHGRGLHSAGQVAILKQRVRACLRQHRAVLAYTDAPRADGGAGAVYVLLRRT